MQELDITSYMKTVLDEISEGVSICDRDSRILFFNKAFEKTEGIPRENIIGKTEYELWQTDFGEKVMESGVPIKNERFVYTTLAGKEVSTVHNVIPYYLNGEVKGMFSISRNITTMDKFFSKTYSLHDGLVKNEYLMKQNGTRYFLENIVGHSPQIIQCIEKAQKAARYSSNVLISGETGTGKELFAQGIHNQSENCQHQFVGINCSAIPESLLESLLFGTEKGAFTGAVENHGLFEQAGQGTLFLDEIDSMPLSMQAKLLRVLSEKKVRRLGGKKDIKVECRIISAINSQLSAVIDQGLLRRDLYYRISSFLLEIPPLRQRENDILLIANHFAKEYAKKLGSDVDGIDKNAQQALLNYSWPGNVRELEHVMESAIIIADNESNQISCGYLPANIQRNNYQSPPTTQLDIEIDLRKTIAKYETDLIKKTLIACNENISDAAKKLNIHRNVLYSKIKKLHICLPIK
jgi:arginine utilization regulatory protein